MKAIVHIGTEKTGTTSIQGYLYLNRRKLRAAGYHFIQSAGKMNNRAIPAYCVGDEKFDDFFRLEGITTPEEKQQFKSRFLREFQRELSSLSSGVHTVIMSSEHFHSRLRTEEEVDNVLNLLSPHFDEIKIICYLREQAATCTSYYSTHLKSGGTLSLARFLERCVPGNVYFNYAAMLANWERSFGRESLDVALFSRDRFLNGNLLDDFTARIDPALVGKLNQDVNVENESLKPSGQALARMINAILPIKTGREEVDDLRERCKKLINQSMLGKGQQPHLDTARAIHDLFLESNERVRETFFPDLEVLFPPPTEPVGENSVVDEAFFQTLEAVVHLIRSQGRNVVAPEDYSRMWGTLTTCVDDAVRVEVVDMHKVSNSVVLKDKDAHFLKNIATRIENDIPAAAYKLMSLAAQVKPDFPAIQKKLREYEAKGLSPPKTSWGSKASPGKPPAAPGARRNGKFIVTYHSVIEDTMDQKTRREFMQRCRRWLESRALGNQFFSVGSGSMVATNGNAVGNDTVGFTGYTIIQAESLDQAITFAQECPYLELGGVMRVSEIAPVGMS